MNTNGRRLDRLEARIRPGDASSERFEWSRLDPAEQERLSELSAQGRDFSHLSPREAYELDQLLAMGMGEYGLAMGLAVEKEQNHHDEEGHHDERA